MKAVQLEELRVFEHFQSYRTYLKRKKHNSEIMVGKRATFRRLADDTPLSK